MGACADFFLFFFFKQKTAYEMRISDWSSDVCSSDLLGPGGYPPDPDAAAASLSDAARRPGGFDGEGHLDPRGQGGNDERTLFPGPFPRPEIGRASCRERVCKYV